MGTPHMDSLHIKVIGVGGGGSNAVDRMIQAGVSGVEFIAANTDAQALAYSEAPARLQLGPNSARGLGVGGDPQWGAQTAEESQGAIRTALQGSDVVFIAAGMGGGTGTGAAPVVARIGRELGALTIAAVTCPFSFEGTRRREVARQGIEALSAHVNSLIAVPNDRLLPLVGRDITFDVALRIADDVLRQGIQGISELITRPGLVNLDFACIRTALEGAGGTLMAIGRGEGPGRAVQAAQAALRSPLLNFQLLSSAKTILVNITGGSDLALHEVGEAAELVAKASHPQANILFGAVVDPELEGEARVILVAGGIDSLAGEVELSHETVRGTAGASGVPIPVNWPMEAISSLGISASVPGGTNGGHSVQFSPPVAHVQNLRGLNPVEDAAPQVDGPGDVAEKDGASELADETELSVVEGTQVQTILAASEPPRPEAPQEPQPVEATSHGGSETHSAAALGRRHESRTESATGDGGERQPQGITFRFLPNLDVPAFLRR